MDIKRNDLKLKTFRSTIINQLKTHQWYAHEDGFKNEHFIFIMIGKEWKFRIIYNSYSSSENILVSEIIPNWRFTFLRILYVNPSIKKFKKLKRQDEIAKMSDRLFKEKKDIIRDTNIDKILNG